MMGRLAAAALVASVALAAPGARAAVVQTAADAGAAHGRVLVMPFDNVAREGRIFWMSEASAVLLTDDLRALGVDAIPRDERRGALEHLQVSQVTMLTDATIIRIGQVLGAATVIVGSLELDGDALAIRARSIALDTGRILANVTESTPIAQVFAAFERLARKLSPPSEVTTDAILRQNPPLPAFEDYVKGLVAETPATAVSYLRAALALHPAFDRARLALWEVYTDLAQHRQALAAVQAIDAGSAVHREAAFRAGLSQIWLELYDDAFATYSALAAENPAATVMNNLGVVQARRGGGREAGTPAYFFTKAADADPADPDYFFNLGYAYWLARDMPSAVYWLREAVRRQPGDGEAHYVLGAAIAAGGGSPGESIREKELARRLSSTFEEWDKRPAGDPVPSRLERLELAIEAPPRTAVLAEQRNQSNLVQFYLERGRRLFDLENDRDALVELNRALFLSPYQAEAQLLLGRIRLRSGQVDEAIDAFKISIWSAETSAAHVALGEAYLEAADPAAARREAERALAMSPESDDAKRLLDRAVP
ncbi:MAG: hypothetical protein IT176_12770 [Acidobacteria bacterium]|nr:hypothetical protein [Acidobacteriota bacterium]